MSSVIRMETEQVRAVAKQLDRISADIQQEIALLGSRVRGMNWQGVSRDGFVEEFAKLQVKIQTCAEQGMALGLRVRREVDEWEQAAVALAAGGLTAIQRREQALRESRQSIQERWDKMSLAERKKWLKQWYKDLCKTLGIPPVTFKVKDLPDPEGKDALGVFSTGIIFGLFPSISVDIDNVKGNDPFQLLDTIAHETRHQYQHYLVKHPDKRPDHISEEQIRAWKENFDNYIKPQDDFEAYRNQPVEKDAREAGDAAVREYVEHSAEVI